MNSTEKLVYMANQIARNFGTMSDVDAAAALAEHIAHFWDPRMKMMIFAHIDAGGDGLVPVALIALRQLQAGAGQAPAA